MRKLLFIATTAATVAFALPAAAQVYGGVGPGGVGVRVGPFAAGVGPDYGWRHHRYAYGYGDCRVVRERIVTPSGDVIYRSRRDCD